MQRTLFPCPVKPSDYNYDTFGNAHQDLGNHQLCTMGLIILHLSDTHGILQARKDVHLLRGADPGLVCAAYPGHEGGTAGQLTFYRIHPRGDADDTLHRARRVPEVHHAVWRRPDNHLRRLRLRDPGRLPSHLHVQEINQGQARRAPQAGEEAQRGLDHIRHLTGLDC